MSDSISRREAINALWVLRGHLQMMDNSQGADLIMHGVFLAEEKIEALPSTNAPSDIVHCKECKNSHMTYGGLCKYCDMWDGDALYLEGDFYCGFGERREDESTL